MAGSGWYEPLLDLLPSPLLLIRPDSGRVFFANRAAHRMAGGTFPFEPARPEYAPRRGGRAAREPPGRLADARRRPHARRLGRHDRPARPAARRRAHVRGRDGDRGVAPPRRDARRRRSAARRDARRRRDAGADRRASRSRGWRTGAPSRCCPTARRRSHPRSGPTRCWCRCGRGHASSAPSRSRATAPGAASAPPTSRPRRSSPTAAGSTSRTPGCTASSGRARDELEAILAGVADAVTVQDAQRAAGLRQRRRGPAARLDRPGDALPAPRARASSRPASRCSARTAGRSRSSSSRGGARSWARSPSR